MNKVKLTLASMGALLLPVAVFAQPVGAIVDLNQLVRNIESAVWIVFGVIAVIMFVVAGVLFLTAQGQPEKVQAARSAFIWGVAGVVVGIIAFSIIAIVSSVVLR